MALQSLKASVFDCKFSNAVYKHTDGIWIVAPCTGIHESLAAAFVAWACSLGVTKHPEQQADLGGKLGGMTTSEASLEPNHILRGAWSFPSSLVFGLASSALEDTRIPVENPKLDSPSIISFEMDSQLGAHIAETGEVPRSVCNTFDDVRNPHCWLSSRIASLCAKWFFYRAFVVIWGTAASFLPTVRTSGG